jgi:hypothetical protein
MSLANWVRQATLTTGTGTITLGSAIDGYVAVGDQYADSDEIYYSITDGTNRENGIGVYTASGTTLARSTVLETLVAGVFDNTSPAAITLSGNAVVSVTATTNGLLTHPPVWKDNLTPLLSAKVPGASAPDLKTFKDGTKCYAFDPTSNEEVYLLYHLNHDYDPGSKYYPHIHWCPEDTDTGVVRWGFEYTQAARDSGTFGATATVYIEQAASGTAFNQLIGEVSDGDAITPPSPVIDSVIIVRVFRDASHANDTYTGDAFGLFCDLHYQASFIGTPNKITDFYAW